MLAAIQYVVSFKDVYDIGVLNLSLGTDSDQPQLLSPLNYAVERAWDAGIVVVVSGGNLGDAGAGAHPQARRRPARHHGRRHGLERHDHRAVTTTSPGYSSLGPVDRGRLREARHRRARFAPRLADRARVEARHGLPGTPTSTLTYARGSGTSFAAGVASGAAALLRQAHPDWTPDQVKEAMTSSAAPGPVGTATSTASGRSTSRAAADGHAGAGQPGHCRPLQRAWARSRRTAGRSRSRSRPAACSTRWRTCSTRSFHLTGDTTAQLEDVRRRRSSPTTDWTGSSWYGSSWWGSSWWGSSWWGSSWWGRPGGGPPGGVRLVTSLTWYHRTVD